MLSFLATCSLEKISALTLSAVSPIFPIIHGYQRAPWFVGVVRGTRSYLDAVVVEWQVARSLFREAIT